MKIKISSIRAFCQYLLFYLLLLCHDAGLYRNNGNEIRLLIFGVCALLIVIWNLKIDLRELIYVVIVAVIMMGLRFLHSDGLFQVELLVVMEHILVAYTAFNIDRDKCATRFVKIVVFFAVVSLFGLTVGNTVPEVFDLPIFTSYEVEWASGSYVFKGVLLYVYRAFEPDRNNGIFTEPGVYQIILSAALFVLLFNNKSLQLKHKTKTVFMIILCIVMVTTASTTGYISLIIVILMGAMQRQYIFPEKKAVRGILLAGLALILVDYFVNGDTSLITKYLIEKLNAVTLNGSEITGSSMNDSSGNARMAVLYQMSQVILTHPLGYGFANFYGLLNAVYDGNAAGARLIIYFAAMGLIPMLILLYPFLAKMWKGKNSIYQFAAYLLIFLNTGMAQSKGIYAAFALLPFITWWEHKSDSVEKTADTLLR